MQIQLKLGFTNKGFQTILVRYFNRIHQNHNIFSQNFQGRSETKKRGKLALNNKRQVTFK